MCAVSASASAMSVFEKPMPAAPHTEHENKCDSPCGRPTSAARPPANISLSKHRSLSEIGRECNARGSQSKVTFKCIFSNFKCSDYANVRETRPFFGENHISQSHLGQNKSIWLVQFLKFQVINSKPAFRILCYRLVLYRWFSLLLWGDRWRFVR